MRRAAVRAAARSATRRHDISNGGGASRSGGCSGARRPRQRRRRRRTWARGTACLSPLSTTAWNSARACRAGLHEHGKGLRARHATDTRAPPCPLRTPPEGARLARPCHPLRFARQPTVLRSAIAAWPSAFLSAASAPRMAACSRSSVALAARTRLPMGPRLLLPARARDAGRRQRQHGVRRGGAAGAAALLRASTPGVAILLAARCWAGQLSASQHAYALFTQTDTEHGDEARAARDAGRRTRHAQVLAHALQLALDLADGLAVDGQRVAQQRLGVGHRAAADARVRRRRRQQRHALGARAACHHRRGGGAQQRAAQRALHALQLRRRSEPSARRAIRRA